MEKESQGTFEGQEAQGEPGVSVSHTRTSEAFMLIVFLIGDLLFVYKSVSLPVNPGIYNGLNEGSFVNLKNKILKNQAAGEFSHLSLQESIFLYMLVDIVCKSFVNEANETLKELAIQNVEISEEEYDILRMNFLRYGQSLIEKMNVKFSANEFFCQAMAKLKGEDLK